MKTKRIVTLLSALLALVMLFGATACNNKPAETTAAPAAVTDAPEAEETEAPEAEETEAPEAEETEAAEASGDSEAEYVITGASANPETHPYGQGLLKFAELLDEKSGGRIQMNSFHAGQLGSERDLVESMQLNQVQVAVITSAPLAGFTDAYLIFDLPFLFASVDEARYLCDSEIGQKMLGSLEDKGVKALAFMENGMRNITNSKLPIENPDDMKGIKIRTMENPMHMEAFSALGADPTPMAFGELFTGLQQKAIDAQENPLVVIHANNFFEVQEYLSMTGHLYSPAPLMMSKEFYDSLPEDLQAVVDEAAIEAAAYQRGVCDEQEAEMLKLLEESGMKVNFTDAAPFREATMQVYDKYVGDGEGKVSPAIYDEAQEVLQEYRDKQ